jgi:hypothetical protein
VAWKLTGGTAVRFLTGVRDGNWEGWEVALGLGTCEKGRRGGEKESLRWPQQKRKRGGDGSGPVAQRTAEGGQFARERGPYVPARSEDRWDSTDGIIRAGGMGQLNVKAGQSACGADRSGGISGFT